MTVRLVRILIALLFATAVSPVRAQQVAGSSPMVDEKTDKSTASNKGDFHHNETGLIRSAARLLPVVIKPNGRVPIAYVGRRG